MRQKETCHLSHILEILSPVPKVSLVSKSRKLSTIRQNFLNFAIGKNYQIIYNNLNFKRGGIGLNSKFNQQDKLLLLEITEEIDHHTTEEIRRRADDEITRFMPRKVVFDFSNVTFMDSAGIGMIIGRYKMMKMLGGSLEMTNVSPSVRKIFEMSGITKICPIKEEVS